MVDAAVAGEYIVVVIAVVGYIVGVVAVGEGMVVLAAVSTAEEYTAVEHIAAGYILKVESIENTVVDDTEVGGVAVAVAAAADVSAGVAADSPVVI